MLVLSRRVDERIVLPTLGAAIQVVAARPGIARLGIEAADDVPVFREEVLARLDPARRQHLVAGSAPEQVRRLPEALSHAAADLVALRRQLSRWQREDLGIALDRIVADLRAPLHTDAVDVPCPTVVAAPSCPADCVVY